MDYQLTVPAILRRTEALFAGRPIVSRRPDRSLRRTTYGDCLRRARRLAFALERLGVRPGDRVATLCWNHDRHLEAYFAVPSLGAVLHTLNLRLHPDELGYIADHAGDRVLLVDRSLLPLAEKFRTRAGFQEVIVLGEGTPPPSGMLDYEELIGAAGERALESPGLHEEDAAAMCYTSGTTGRSKGVVYSHRALVLHSLATAMPDGFALGASDVVLTVVPMFHANAWGLPYTAALVGAGLVFPGEHPDARSLLELCQSEGVTFSAGVPTVWIDLLDALDATPGGYDLSRLRTIVIGGAAAPESLIRGLGERHGVRAATSWGMTELTPVGTKQGLPGALLELRVRNDAGEVPWDGATMGELEVRGAYVASAYYGAEEAETSFTADGWFRTGDIASIDPRGHLEIRDRGKDLIKSGGEWISSVALEGALMSHPAVAEAAVVAVPHPRWLERPVAAVVLREGRSVTPAELRAHLAGRFPQWWLPDDVVFLPAIPRSSTGKFLKSALRDWLRERFREP
ncbi:MAG: long-chain fatty acid--CoA ligase [Gemmatimonadales bacterium]